jgi:RsiW-degrading membrane proteinase PrsW (M82 family)
MGVLVVLAEAIVAMNVMIIFCGAVVWIALAGVTWICDRRVRTRTLTSQAAAAPAHRPVTAYAWPARAMASRIAVMMAVTVVAFEVAYRGAAARWPDEFLVGLFGIGVVLLCLINLLSAILLVRFGRLLTDVFRRGMAPGRDAVLAYAVVTFAFAVPAVGMLAAGFRPFGFSGA